MSNLDALIIKFIGTIINLYHFEFIFCKELLEKFGFIYYIFTLIKIDIRK